MVLKQRLISNLSGFVTGSYITGDACDAAFERMHQRDRIGDRIHLVLACVAMFGIAGPVSVVDLAMLPLVGFFVVRVVNTFPVWVHGFGQPVVLVGLMLAGLMGVSLLWSVDPAAGLEHIGELRWLAMIGFIYPVIEHRRVLIASLCIGFVFGYGAQVIDAFDGFGNAWLADRLWHEPNRISGWWDPAVGGSVLVGALGLHLPAALMGSGKVRAIGLLGSSATIVALIATGTRGAWVAAVGLIVVGVCVSAWVGRLRLRSMVVGGVVLMVAVVAMGVLKGDAISERLTKARSEIGLAVEGDFSTSTGARISMWVQAMDAGLEHPIGGIGAGGFEHWMQERTSEVLDDHAHAHSSVLRLWSEHGVFGVLFGGLLVVVVLVGAWRSVGVDERGSYLMGPFFGLVGLVLVSVFDSVLLNVNTMALFGGLAALGPAYMPLGNVGTMKNADD